MALTAHHHACRTALRANSSRGPLARDIFIARARAIDERLDRVAKVNEAGDALAGVEAQGVADERGVRRPFRDPVGDKTHCVSGNTERRSGGAGGEDLLPLRNWDAFAHTTDDGDD